MENSVRNLSNECESKCKELQMNTFLNMADWAKVTEISGVDEIRQSIRRALPAGSVELGGMISTAGVSAGGRRSTYSKFDDSEISAETRFRFLRALRMFIWEGFESGQMGAAAA